MSHADCFRRHFYDKGTKLFWGKVWSSVYVWAIQPNPALIDTCSCVWLTHTGEPQIHTDSYWSLKQCASRIWRIYFACLMPMGNCPLQPVFTWCLHFHFSSDLAYYHYYVMVSDQLSQERIMTTLYRQNVLSADRFMSSLHQSLQIKP